MGLPARTGRRFNTKRLILLSMMTTLLVAGNVCRAEPTATVRYLMKTPVSMFDYGIGRLQESLLSILKHYGYSGGFYVQCRIPPVRLPKFEPIKSMNESEARDQCKHFVGTIRVELGLEANTDKPYLYARDHSSLASYFSHAGYKQESEPKNLNEELDQITEIEVFFRFYEKETSLESKSIRAKAPLLGSEISFSDK